MHRKITLSFVSAIQNKYGELCPLVNISQCHFTEQQSHQAQKVSKSHLVLCIHLVGCYLKLLLPVERLQIIVNT